MRHNKIKIFLSTFLLTLFINPYTFCIENNYSDIQSMLLDIKPFEEEIEIVSSMQVFEYLKAHRLLGRSRINDVKTALEFIGGRYIGQVRVKQRIDNQDKIIKPTLYIIRNHPNYDGKQGQEIVDHYKPFPYSWIDGD